MTETKINWSNVLKSGQRIFIGSHAAVPTALIDDLIENSKDLHDIEIVQLMTLSDNKWAEPQYQQLFKVNTFFIGGGTIRKAVNEGRADYTPSFISDIPNLFNNGILPLDAALIMVAPGDKYGYHSMGVSVDVVAAAAKSAKTVIAQVNPQMPVTYGQSFLHENQIDYFGNIRHHCRSWRRQSTTIAKSLSVLVSMFPPSRTVPHCRLVLAIFVQPL